MPLPGVGERGGGWGGGEETGIALLNLWQKDKFVM